MYIEYVAHANNHRGNQIVENSWWALARMHVGKTRSTNGIEGCLSIESNEWRKMNDEATSINAHLSLTKAEENDAQLQKQD